MLSGAKALAEKISQYKKYSIDLKFSIIQGASHETVFPTTAIQGIDWIYGKKMKK